MPRLLPLKRRSDIARLGSAYGGWIVPERSLKAGSICYCVGAGTDISFDLALARDHSCEVYCFDPTPAAIRHVADVAQGEERFHFYPYGIWIEDTEMRFYEPEDPAHVSHSITNIQGTERYFTATCRTIPSVMEELGHRELDILKLDVEGAEYAVLSQLVDRNEIPAVVCVEFDQPVEARSMLRLVRRLLKTHELIAVDGWNYTFLRKPDRTYSAPPSTAAGAEPQ